MAAQHGGIRDYLGTNAMSARDLLQRLQNQPLGTALDWRALREEIHDEFERATSGEDRAILLAIFQTVMD